jgi:steroid delta-isomerase-like uncharacterized protein
MKPLDSARQYLDAWNARDARAIVKTFAAGGTYRDPAAGTLPGHAVGTYAESLWSAFPDLSFEIASLAEAGAGRVVAEWIMRGTNTGAFQGLPATGRTICVAGVDVIAVGGDGIQTVTGYFDTRAIPEQLGLQIVVQPDRLGPFHFGVATAVPSGKRTKPGAFAITTIWNSDEQTETIRTLTRETAKEMLGMEGFIGASFVRLGGRGITISAWERPEQTKQLMKGGTHADAMKRFWADVGSAGFTSVWVPHHINALWVRCGACKKMKSYESHAGVCSCGQPLPEAPAYF